jgi:DNA-binding ferritin-like protein
MDKPRMLKRSLEAAKTISRPQIVVTQPKSEPSKPQPTPDTGVGGSSLDTMTAFCATEMMNASISFHRLHLKVKGDGSFSAHVALGTFYKSLHDHADTLIEGYQGVAEKLLDYSNTPVRTLDTVSDAVAYLRDMYNSINKLQGMMPYSEIVNNLDLVKDSINNVKYKLLFLK